MEKLSATTMSRVGAGNSGHASTTKEPRFQASERLAASADK
jgi:hypothetical protein